MCLARSEPRTGNTFNMMRNSQSVRQGMMSIAINSMAKLHVCTRGINPPSAIIDLSRGLGKVRPKPLGKLRPKPLGKLRPRLAAWFRACRLNADDLDAGAHGLDVGGDACNEAAPAHRHEHVRQAVHVRALLQDLLAHRALPAPARSSAFTLPSAAADAPKDGLTCCSISLHSPSGQQLYACTQDCRCGVSAMTTASEGARRV